MALALCSRSCQVQSAADSSAPAAAAPPPMPAAPSAEEDEPSRLGEGSVSINNASRPCVVRSVEAVLAARGGSQSAVVAI